MTSAVLRRLVDVQPVDFRPSTDAMARLVRGVRDDQLGAPTPCPAYSVADLLDHIGGLAMEFTASGHKAPSPSAAPEGDGTRLEPGWRERIGHDLEALAAAWVSPAAYEGTTHAGPVDLPAPEVAKVALDEVVVHAWDLARATGQIVVADPSALAICTDFVASFDAPANDDGGLFGPPVEVGGDADPLDRLVAMTGRDPAWAP